MNGRKPSVFGGGERKQQSERMWPWSKGSENLSLTPIPFKTKKMKRGIVWMMKIS